MAEPRQPSRRWRAVALLFILVMAVGVRLYRLDAPILDQMYAKQIYVANKARNIAGPPLSPLRNTLSFLQENGERIRLTEEVPLYTGLVGWGYAVCGEREWLGRVASLLATLVAILALYDLMGREFDPATGLVAAFLFAVCPLLVFYGRAVLPDPAMLASMLVSACCWHRHLEREGLRWLVAAGLAGLLGAMFKYYGLMILLPLAEMAWRRGGWRAWFGRDFLLLCALMMVPIAVWIVGVFVPTPNPVEKMPYFVFQEPAVVLQGRFYYDYFCRFLIIDCGPVTAILIVIALLGALKGMVQVRPLRVWALMGTGFFVLLAPKLIDHDYYELMLLPAAATCAALGWKRVGQLAGTWLHGAGARALGAAILVAAVVFQSPLFMRSKFDLEVGNLILAARLDQLCSPAGRVVVIGPGFPWPVVHYCGHEGWVLHHRTLPPDWKASCTRYRSLGAEYLALYFDPTVLPKDHASYEPLWTSLPVVEHRAGPWFRSGKPCEYYIFRLEGDALRWPGSSGPGPEAGGRVATDTRSATR